MTGLIEESQALAKRLDSLDERLWARTNSVEEVGRQGVRELQQQVQQLERQGRLAGAAAEEAQKRQVARQRRIDHLLEDFSWRLAKAEEDQQKASPGESRVESQQSQLEKRFEVLDKQLRGCLPAVEDAHSRLQGLEAQFAELAEQSAMNMIGAVGGIYAGQKGGLSAVEEEEDKALSLRETVSKLEREMAEVDRKLSSQLEQLATGTSSLKVKLEGQVQRHNSIADRLEAMQAPALESLRTSLADERAKDLRDIQGRLAQLGQKVELSMEGVDSEKVLDRMDRLAQRVTGVEAVTATQRRESQEIRSEVKRALDIALRPSTIEESPQSARFADDGAPSPQLQNQLNAVADKLDVLADLPGRLRSLEGRVAGLGSQLEDDELMTSRTANVHHAHGGFEDAAALEDIKRTVADLDDRVLSLMDARVEAPHSSDLDARFVALEDRVDALAVRPKEHATNSNTELMSRMSKLEDSVTVLASSTPRESRSRPNPVLESLPQQFSALENRFSQVEARSTKALEEGRKSAEAAALAQIEPLLRLPDRLRAVEDEVAELSAKAADEPAKSKKEDAGPQLDALVGLPARTSSLEQRVAALDRRCDEQVVRLDERFSVVDQRCDEQATRLGDRLAMLDKQWGDKLNATSDRLGDLEAWSEKQDDRLSAMQAAATAAAADKTTPGAMGSVRSKRSFHDDDVSAAGDRYPSPPASPDQSPRLLPGAANVQASAPGTARSQASLRGDTSRGHDTRSLRSASPHGSSRASRDALDDLQDCPSTARSRLDGSLAHSLEATPRGLLNVPGKDSMGSRRNSLCSEHSADVSVGIDESVGSDHHLQCCDLTEDVIQPSLLSNRSARSAAPPLLSPLQPAAGKGLHPSAAASALPDRLSPLGDTSRAAAADRQLDRLSPPPGDAGRAASAADGQMDDASEQHEPFDDDDMSFNESIAESMDDGGW
eukprot:TRINITY_DN48868_c0_g1_i1.p1 TRINITY_DN48868_c0_g1~~TRINITY_DN48868_c0_g1_i1.p1  ORF type:complete len:947 (-),score=251.31 TRINITY_DN48868_c0_g1_i1:215-3055(-)